jgi:hypothetical protein
MKRQVLLLVIVFFILIFVLACSKPNEPAKVIVAKRVIKFMLNKPVVAVMTMSAPFGSKPGGFVAPEQITDVEGAQCSVAITDPSDPTKEIIVEGLMMKGATFKTHKTDRELNGDLGYKSADGKTQVIYINHEKFPINR